ncbi:type II toxin-antitoxin system death-on-curing family toxin [Megalodesulfovibrio gigas]|uniref:Putative death-on-curing family protein n=1 Tax=Megalodesulfovibrio gigas (strain ATCC 19364 / DSM 1382 / NCIMB 9332 / VKM B-1759) TaxID=1121448 RepID=T2G991_MEGG1|nr:type II toxin-antitoxin system death-on-curing family toxin [Megalodesulfovibrio gigas]AGW13150.1 putative death-on-curing family protein [Megalodesulfovibrio gigas DSM 1382 = ATCC 19364]
MKTFYFTLSWAIETHRLVIEQSGGVHGVKDRGLLESVLTHIQNDDYYPEFLDKLTHLCFAVNKLHAFHDGNKRASLALGAFFLLLNGYDHCVTPFLRDMENITVWVAENAIKKELLRDILQDIILQAAREEVRLAIIHATQHAHPDAQGGDHA